MSSSAKVTRNRSFSGRGTCYIREKGVATGFEAMGNADAVTFAIGENKITQRDYQTPGGGNIASQSSITDVTCNINALSVQPNTLAIALRSLVNTTAGAAQASEGHVAFKNSLVPLDFIPDTDETITVSAIGGGTVYVEGTDYEVRGSGIFILEDGSITDATDLDTDNIEVSYTSITSYDIEGITESAVEYEFYFDGFNEADNGKPVTMQCHKVQFSPSQALDLITEEFGALPLVFEVLSDSTVTGAGESKFFKVRLAE